MAAWQHSSSFRRMPSAASTPTAAARGVAVMQKLQDPNHHAAANRHCVDSQSDFQSEPVQEVPGSTPTSTSTSTGSGGDRESDTTAIRTSPNARNKKGTSKHGGCVDGSSERRDGVPRRLILTQGHNDIQHPHPHPPNPTSLEESKRALQKNDSMCYLDGPQVYTCANCRTHLTSHDDIISKSFHGRNGRAYLFDQCVNITTGPPEDRILITGLHTVSDISCKRCQALVGWTYAKAYEPSQKYKEGKYIIEKIYLHMEESDYYTVDRPAGERGDRWQVRSMSWGSEESQRGFACTSGSYHRGDKMHRMGSPSLPDGGGVDGAGADYSRGRSVSMGGISRSQHHARSSPQTPPKPHRQSSISPGGNSMMKTTSSTTTTTKPKSPRSPSDIIYEYPNML